MPERQRTPDEIRAEIEQTRADMDETVQAISNRLSPGQIVDQMWDRVRTGDAAASFVDVVKEHPVPAMLMGLGLGWLMYERTSMSDGDRLRKKFGDVGPGTYAPADGRVGPYLGKEALATDHGSGVADKAKAALSSVRDAASSVGEQLSSAAASVAEGVSGARDSLQDVGERAGELSGQAGERAHQLREHASERVDQVRERASRVANQAWQGASRTYDEQPLALGALSFGLGLASGLVVPSTSVEDRMVGDRADRLKGELRGTATEKLAAAKRVATAARDAARDAVQREGMTDLLKERVRAVAEEARTAAMQTARREGLAPRSSPAESASGARRIADTGTGAADRPSE